jgi:hypothetical protein
MSQETDLKRKKVKTALFLLVTVVALYLTVIIKQWE